MRPAGLEDAVASLTGGLDAATAARAERVAGLYPSAAARAIHQQGLAQDEVENDADAVEEENGQQRPHHVAHAAAAGIAVDIADKQGVAGHGQRHQSRDEEPEGHGDVVHHDKEETYT